MKIVFYSVTGINLLLLLISCKANHHENPKSYKFSERSKVEWSDFKGYRGWTTDKFDAAISSGVGYNYTERIENGNLVLDFNVYAFFDQGNSWSNYKEGVPSLLKHEQYHLHISEIWARMLRKTLMGCLLTKNYEHEIWQHYCVNQAYRTVMQNTYDEETKHSTIVEEQKKWEEKVVQLMWETQGYANETFTVKTNLPITDAQLLVL
jgi:hypothetical protein